MKIEEHIKEILSEWTFEGNKYFLPKVQLDRKDYVKCNDVLEAIGMKWNRWQKAHIGDGDDLEETFRGILETGEVETLKEYRDKFQFFPTPDSLANYLIELSNIEDCKTYEILEPSAWQWAIASKIQDIHNLTCIELDPKNMEILKTKIIEGKNEFLCLDFLDYDEKKFDRIIMNPPFCNSQDAKHILHAYSLLKDGGTLVSVASSSIQTREGKVYDELRELPIEWFEVNSGAFKESGTMVNTVILRIIK